MSNLYPSSNNPFDIDFSNLREFIGEPKEFSTEIEIIAIKTGDVDFSYEEE